MLHKVLPASQFSNHSLQYNQMRNNPAYKYNKKTCLYLTLEEWKTEYVDLGCVSLRCGLWRNCYELWAVKKQLWEK